MYSIFVQPDEVWAQCETLHNLGTSSLLLAEYPDGGVEIYLNAIDSLDGYIPEISVELDNDQIAVSTCETKEECEETARQFYNQFLNESNLLDYVINGMDYDDDDNGNVECEDNDTERIDTAALAIEDREQDLTVAFAKLMQVIAEDSDSGYPEKDVIDDLKEHVLEYMHRKHNFNIYRPMVVEYDDGSEEYLEYPYDSLKQEFWK